MPLFTDEKKQWIKDNIIIILRDNSPLTINSITNELKNFNINIQWETTKFYLDQLVKSDEIIMFKVSKMTCYKIK